ALRSPEHDLPRGEGRPFTAPAADASLPATGEAGPLLKRPRLRPHFHVEVMPGEGILLLSDARNSLLRGRLYELVAPCLDGRTADDVCVHLRSEAPPAEVHRALIQLERKGYLCEAEETLPAGQAALWSSQQVAPATAARRLAERTVVVQAFGVEAGPLGAT